MRAIFKNIAGLSFVTVSLCFAQPAHLIEAAKLGDSFAQLQLGELHESGRGVTKDLEAAVQWYRQSALQGNAIAQYNLASMLEEGEGVSVNDQEALFWYRKAAEQGDAPSQLALGLKLANGIGEKKVR